MRNTFLGAVGPSLLFMLALGSPLRAQSAAIVPATDLVYADIDRLSELGMLDSIIIGQRPYSRDEIRRIARTARNRLERGTGAAKSRWSDEASNFAEQLLRRIETRFGTSGDDEGRQEPVVALFDGASLSFLSTDTDRRGFPSPGARATEATIDPLAKRRLGKPAVTGQTGALELSQHVAPTSWLAFQARERVEYRNARDSTLKRTDGEVLLASARARYRNVALMVGRQEITWAQHPGDGLFLSSDAPALDQISLAGDHPFMLPWLLRYLGSTQATIVLADLGPSVARSGSKLLTYKVSIQPFNAVELGGTFMDHFAGAGGRSSSFGDQLVDFLPFIDVFRKHNYTDTTRAIDVDSDKLLGVDGRVRIDPLGGITLTGELLIDDFDVHRIPKLLTGYGSQTFALIVPQMGSPALSLKLSAKHMGIITYTHFDLSDGITTRGRLLGDELGPDAKAYSAKLRWTPAAEVRVELEGSSAIYSNATYTSFYSDPAQTRFVVQKASHGTDELRERVVGTLVYQSLDGVALTMRAGAERTRNAFFTGGRRRDYVAEIALRLGQ